MAQKGWLAVADFHVSDYEVREALPRLFGLKCALRDDEGIQIPVLNNQIVLIDRNIGDVLPRHVFADVAYGRRDAPLVDAKGSLLRLKFHQRKEHEPYDWD